MADTLPDAVPEARGRGPKTDQYQNAPHVTTSLRGERAALAAFDLVLLTLAVPAALGSGQADHATVYADVIGVFLALGSVRPRLRYSLLDDLPRLAVAVIAGCVCASALLWVAVPRDTDVSAFIAALGAALLAVMVSRTLGYALLRARRAKLPGRPTLIVGTGVVAAHLARTLCTDPGYALRPIGQVIAGARRDDNPLPMLGTPAQLPKLLAQHRISHVLIAFSEQREADLIEILRACEDFEADVLCVPRLFEVHPDARASEDIAGVPLVRLSCGGGGHRVQQLAKRAFDILVAALALLLAAPVLAVCALAVRIEGGPGVLFRQERVGQDGRTFTLLKFRSMRPANDQEAATRWNIAEDVRLGPFGKLLRRTSLDELPQLLNVLMGQMSLVGPRPERPHFVAEFAARHARYGHRHRAPVGMTGWAQVNGLRGDTSIADRVMLDNWYIENWSLWLDVKIMLRTAGAVLRELRG